MNLNEHGRVIKTVIAVVLGLNALDFSTALMPSPADHLWPIPERSSLRLWLQGLLLVTGLYWARHAPKAVWDRLTNAGVPASARIAMLAFICVAMVHVSLRQEAFPFSPVTMFSSAVTPRTGDGVEVEGYLVITEDRQLIPFPALLEGNAWLSKYDTGWDYKAGWTMHLYGFVQSGARDEIVRVVNESKGLRVHRTPYVYDRRDGAIISPTLERRRGQ